MINWIYSVRRIRPHLHFFYPFLGTSKVYPICTCYIIQIRVQCRYVIKLPTSHKMNKHMQQKVHIFVVQVAYDLFIKYWIVKAPNMYRFRLQLIVTTEPPLSSQTNKMFGASRLYRLGNQHFTDSPALLGSIHG